MKKPRPKPAIVDQAALQPSAVEPRKHEPNPYLLIFYTALVTAVIGGLVGWFSGIIPGMLPTSTDDPHTYSITMQGRTISGESTNPFEDAQGYQARVEVCHRHGIEDILVTVACYLTVRPSQNLTISNSRNATTATYQDGSFAPICCMAVGDGTPDALYRVEVPPGSVSRRTFRRGEDVHVFLNIPDADPGRILDAISFSPGEGAPAVVFPLRENLVDQVFTREFIDARRNDPRIQELIRDTINLRDQLRAREGPNRGLTYPG